MKSKRINKISICTLLFLFVFIISLFSSINAFADNTDFKIEDAIILEKSELVDGNISSFDNDTIINDVTFHKLDDYVTYKIVIKNKTNDDLMINSIVDDNNNSYIVYEYDKHENYNVKGNKSFEFLVKAIYKNELTDTTLRNQTSKVNFTLNYIKNNKEVEQRLSLNPNTKDNIHISFIALTISLIGLSTCLILNKKKNGKLFIIIGAGILISPIIVKALDLTFSITLDNNYHLYDKLLVTYNVQGNEHTVVNPYGELINNIETQTPQINGYTFEKWQLEDGSDFDSTKPITDDIKLIAKMKLDSYGITYDFGRSSDVINNNPTTYTVLDSITLNYPIKTGYTFNYWTGTILEENTKDVSFSNQTGELLFNGFFKANSYEIAFDNNTGEGVMSNLSMKYDEVKNLTLNTFTKTGYTFNGWNTKKDGSGNSYRDGEEISNLSYEDNSTVTLYAMWKPNQYTVIFNSNTGTGLMDREIFNYDETKKLSANLFEKEHYKFMGWNTETDGSGEHFDDEASVSNLKTDGEIILYAEWKERTATLNTGAVVNSVLRTISTDATKFKHYDGNNLPNFDTYDSEEIISTEDSNFPVYVWVDDDTIYWWSEAERPNFNSNSSNMFNNMNKLETINLDGLESSTAINMSQFFNGCSKLSSLDISEFNTGNVTNMSNMFSGTSALTSIDTSVLDTKNVTNMSGMFSKTGVTSIDISNFDTKNVKTMRSLFDYSKAATVIIGDINTSNVTDMYSMFGDMANIKSLDLSGLDTDNVTNMASMFCAFHVTSKLTDLDISTFNTEKVQNFSLMFYGQSKLTELDLRHFNTSSATTMYMMFSGTSSLRTLDVSGWTNDKVTNMSYMFNYGGNTNINFTNFNTSNVTDMTGMFADMRSAQVLDLSGFDTANVKKMANMFGSSYSSTPMALKTVYVSDKFVVSEANSTVAMFSNARSIVGGAGTVFDGNLGTNAVIDDPDNGRAGYFTLKDARYIRFNGNGADNQNSDGVMTSYYISTNTPTNLKLNEFVRDGYVFTGWNTLPDGTGIPYTDGQLMTGLEASKTPLTLYARWRVGDSTLQTGANVNSALRNVNANATTFTRYKNGTPDFTAIENERVISLSTSTDKTWVWSEGDTIYWWSEAKPKFNANSANMFQNMTKLTTIDLDGFDISTATNLNNFFKKCSSVEELDLTPFNGCEPTSVTSMFEGCSSLTTVNLDKLNTSKVVDFTSYLKGCSSLTSLDLSTINTSNATNLTSMLEGCSSITSLDLSKLNSIKVENMSSLFKDMSGLTTLDLSKLTTAKVTNMSNMFNGCHSIELLDVSPMNTALVENMSGMFRNLKNITTVKTYDTLETTKFTTSNVTDMSFMFAATVARDDLYNIDVSHFDTSNVINMSSMFSGSDIRTIDVSSFDTRNVTNMSSMFFDCKVYSGKLDLSNFYTPKLAKADNIFYADGGMGANVIDVRNFDFSKLTSFNIGPYGQYSGRTWHFGKLDLSSLPQDYVIRLGNNVTRIYVNNEYDSSIIVDKNIKINHSLRGITGTRPNSELGITADNPIYYRVDDPDNGKPGFFWLEDSAYVRFNGNGADNADPYGAMTSYYISTKTSEALKANAFTRLGYKFIGWNTKADGSGVSYTDKQLMEDVNADTIITLYAQWEQIGATCVKQYRLQNADGTYPEEYIIESSDVVGIGEDCSFEKSVDGYQTKSDSITVTAIGATVSLDLPRNTYTLTISYDSEQFSSVIGEGTYRWGEEVPVMAMINMFGMESYEFANWTQIDGVEGSFENTTYSNTVFVMGKGNATIKPNAQAKTYTYTLVYDANGGEGAPPSQTKETNSRYGMVEFEISNKIPTREGYGFWGWGEASTSTKSMYNSSDQRVEPMDPGVTTIYAVWKPVSGTVQEWNGCSSMEVGTPIYLLDTRDGQAYEVNKYYMNAEHTETACWMDNLNLGSWNINEDLTSSNTNLTSTILAEDFLSWNVKEFNTTGDRDSYTVPMFVPKYSYGYRGSGSDSYGTRYGVSYNTLLASANTYDRTTGNLSSDICPKGWHIPTGGDDGELVKLVVAYGGINGKMTAETSPTHLEMAEILEHDLKFAFAGNLNYGAKEKLGAYMSSATSGTSYLISLFIEPELYNKQVTITNYAPAYYGYSIRCVKE